MINMKYQLVEFIQNILHDYFSFQQNYYKINFFAFKHAIFTPRIIHKECF